MKAKKLVILDKGLKIQEIAQGDPCCSGKPSAIK